MIPEPLHGRPGQQVALSVLYIVFQLRAAHRRRYWIDQQLKGELRPSTVPRHERHHGREIPAGAVPSDRHRIAANLRRFPQA
jgi:hypothetical protein